MGAPQQYAVERELAAGVLAGRRFLLRAEAAQTNAGREDARASTAYRPARIHAQCPPAHVHTRSGIRMFTAVHTHRCCSCCAGGGGGAGNNRSAASSFATALSLSLSCVSVPCVGQARGGVLDNLDCIGHTTPDDVAHYRTEPF